MERLKRAWRTAKDVGVVLLFVGLVAAIIVVGYFLDHWRWGCGP